jgi:isopentenyl-diphosphate delta-isomerase
MVDSDELVVLVDQRDTPIGLAPKLAAHRDGLLHRAVSVLLFDDTGRVLLQRRAAGKYHSPSLWSNTCCGHPRPNESSHDAACRRLREEMGIANCPIEFVGWFVYRAEGLGALIEFEVDHVYVGRWSGPPHPDPLEVASWRWCTLDELRGDLASSPRSHTVWLPKLLAHLGMVLHADGPAASRPHMTSVPE